jgi:hypothetical protein
MFSAISASSKVAYLQPKATGELQGRKVTHQEPDRADISGAQKAEIATAMRAVPKSTIDDFDPEEDVRDVAPIVKPVIIEKEEPIDFDLDAVALPHNVIKKESEVLIEYALSKDDNGKDVGVRLFKQAKYLSNYNCYGIPHFILEHIGAIQVRQK